MGECKDPRIGPDGSSGKGTASFRGYRGGNTSWLSVALTGLIVGCSGGQGAPATGGDPNLPSGGGFNLSGSPDGEVSEGEIIGSIVVEAPVSRDFVLTATLPVPKGTLTDGALAEPLSVRTSGGSAAPTQVEIVSRYPNLADGADVVQIISHVRRPDGVAPGTPVRYEVGVNPHRRHELELPTSVTDFLSAPGALKLQARDVYGNSYNADLLADVRSGNGDARVLADGHVMRKVRTHEILLPESVVQGQTATLPHMMGVHAYVTAFRGQEFLGVDLHVHNGMDGLDASSSADDALDDLYFRDLVLRLPSGWRAAFAVDNPAGGENAVAGAWNNFQLIEERSDGRVHLMPKLARMARRLVIYKPAAEERALEQLNAGWQGFCAAGDSPNGNAYYSWWNSETARYWAQNQQLPNLDYIGIENLREEFNSKCDLAETQFRTGASGPHPIQSGALGWAHPWGVAYQGMTGGDEINILDGHLLAASASRRGYQYTQMRMRGYCDRQPQALYGVDGDPTCVEDILVSGGGSETYMLGTFFHVPTGSADPFGFQQAPMQQAQSVLTAGTVADYAEELQDWMPIDYQHYIRFTKDLKTLAWLGNDAMAKDLLAASAENFRMSYHQYRNDSGGYTQVTGLRNSMDLVAQYPGQGLPFGRGESWGIDANLCAYAFQGEEFRTARRSWLNIICDTVVEGQSNCTGNIEAYHIAHLFGGQAMVRQAMEASFIDATLWGMAATVFDGVDESRKNALLNAVVGNATATVSAPFWNETANAPWSTIACGPSDPSQGEYCLNVPSNFNTGYVQTTEGYSSLAYAYQLTQDPFYLERAAQMMGGGDLWTLLEGLGSHNTVNTGPLVTVMQRMRGEL